MLQHLGPGQVFPPKVNGNTHCCPDAGPPLAMHAETKQQKCNDESNQTDPSDIRYIKL